MDSTLYVLCGIFLWRVMTLWLQLAREEEEKQMTLDEWKKLQAKKVNVHLLLSCCESRVASSAENLFSSCKCCKSCAGGTQVQSAKSWRGFRRWPQVEEGDDLQEGERGRGGGCRLPSAIDFGQPEQPVLGNLASSQSYLSWQSLVVCSSTNRKHWSVSTHPLISCLG